MQSCSFQFCMCPCHAAGKVNVPAPYDSAASVMGGEESRNIKQSFPFAISQSHKIDNLKNLY